jgi:hypothetical protein
MLHIGTKYDAMFIQDFSLIGLRLIQVFSEIDFSFNKLYDLGNVHLKY